MIYRPGPLDHLVKENSAYRPSTYLGFTIIMQKFTDFVGPATYYPVVYKDQSWVHEFGCQWYIETDAEFKAIGYIDSICQ